MHYLLDTVGLVRHFTGAGRIGRQAAFILDNLEQSEDTIAISVVSLMEVMSVVLHF
jgi:predicted nucleic acid-binding protein